MRWEVQPGALPSSFLAVNVPFNDDTIHVYVCKLASVNGA